MYFRPKLIVTSEVFRDIKVCSVKQIYLSTR